MSDPYDIQQVKAQFPVGRRLLGMDPGTKTIGLALSDVMRTVATPLEIIKRKKFKDDVIRIKEIVQEHNIGGFVIGLPKNMDGSEGPRCQATRAFVRNLEAHFDLPIALWDERLSTAAVERTLLEADSSRAKRKDVVDKMAAAYILQGAMYAL
ncbi:putative pre-16S rRNA nuclease [Kordiimonas sediminis]|uniref:Putative pre-16S rRNA nuclease n=1 Tax=Kordiimonas sediminis TaxID=1735581 RepID=A0A919AVQ3_9PROT|nr:Holliday junction resolvase RuvX [Kordiimonas sediminis]GHF25810.1 putative pre-16S rRNA nuclease [Kordiimonas sediminis]